LNLLLKTPRQIVAIIEQEILQRASTPVPAIGRAVESVTTETIREVFEDARYALDESDRVWGED
jgi:hypothetical protein